MSNALARALGTEQGRIQPTGTNPPAGAFVFALGYDLPGRVEEIVENDFAQVEQTISFDVGSRILHADIVARPPREALPAGLVWRVRLLVDAVAHAEHVLVPGAKTRALRLSANVSKLAAGPHVVAVRLEMVAVP